MVTGSEAVSPLVGFPGRGRNPAGRVEPGRMRRAVLTLLAPVVLLTGWVHADAAGRPAPQVVDAGGDSLATKHQDIKSVLFSTKGPVGNQALVVTLSTWSPVMPELSTFNYEVDVKASCGDLSLSMSPSTPYEKVTGLNGWVSSSCGGDVSDLISAQVRDNTITWVVPLDGKVFTKGTTFTDFEARIDLAQPALPFPSSITGTALGLVDVATSKATWRLR